MVVGEDELKEGQVLLKDLVKKEQIKVPYNRESLLSAIKRDSIT